MDELYHYASEANALLNLYMEKYRELLTQHEELLAKFAQLLLENKASTEKLNSREGCIW